MPKKGKHYTRNNKHVHKKKKEKKRKHGPKRTNTKKKRGIDAFDLENKRLQQIVPVSGQTGTIIVSFLKSKELSHLVRTSRSEPIIEDAKKRLAQLKLNSYVLFVNKLFVKPHPDEIVQYMIDNGKGLSNYRTTRELIEQDEEVRDEEDDETKNDLIQAKLELHYLPDYVNECFGEEQGQTQLTHFIIYNETLESVGLAEFNNMNFDNLINPNTMSTFVNDPNTRIYKVNFGQYENNERVSGIQFLMDLERVTKRTLSTVLNV